MESTGRIEQGYDRLVQNYRILKDKYKEQSKYYSRKMIQSGWIRVLCFVLMFVLPFYIFEYSVIASAIVFIAFISCFVWLIKRFNHYKRLKNEFLFLKELNHNEIAALEGNWCCFGSGEKFKDPLHNYSYDLDLFGESSFFQFINRSATINGEKRLAEFLTYPSLDVKEIKRNQEVFHELSKALEFRQSFYAKGKVLNETEEDIKKVNSFKDYSPWLKTKSTFFKIVIRILPGLFILSFIWSFFGMNPVIPTVIFLFNLSFIGANLKATNKFNLKFSSLSSILQNYASLTNLIADQEFTSEGLVHLKNKLSSENANASLAIKKLSVIMSHFDQRNGMLAGVILNGILLWDFKYVLKIENWLYTYKSQLFDWFYVVQEIDAYNSLAGYVYNHPDYVFPEISNDEVFNVEYLGHPLIDRKERICNDFNFKDSVFTLITGANMSGKSTFLRSIGLNLVLANCGAVVCADKMIYKPMELVTNMRTTDSLMKHESYFFAELKRLKYIIDKLRNGKDIFIILDEILKGTNSKDKTYGSMELIRNLLNYHAYGMIATHDLELEILEGETSGRVENFCFEVKNESGKLLFDYKLYKGVTQNHNASFLMKKMGIIPVE